ncbi:hypothetical protein VPHPG9A1_0026 [Vibrio phage PG9A-1]
MKKVLDWFKWINYRVAVAKEMRMQLSGAWGFWECWKYSKCFQVQYEDLISKGDSPIPADDVEEELHCWAGN